MVDTKKYIIQFLLGEHIPSEITELIGYTADESEFEKYKLVIYPSFFFDNDVYGKTISLPALPLKIWEEVPILFGEPTIEIKGNTKIIYADLVASSYFLISRYEEMVRREVRDVYGRFPGKESLPYRAGFIDRPLVDQYAKILRLHLREMGVEVPEPPHQISKVFLTHDVDQISHFRSIRGLAGGMLRGLKRPKEAQRALKSFFGGLQFDPWYTFPYLFNLDSKLRLKMGEERCEIIAFIRTGGYKHKQDKPFVNLQNPDFKALLNYAKRKKVTIGLHSSFEVGLFPNRVNNEKRKLEKTIKHTTNYNRNHFLCSREPEDMLMLIGAGITDDFTMGYADMAGFRLGTCRAVKYINLSNRQVTSLNLHPLPVMDRSLNDKRYMYMNAHDAYQYCTQLIDNVESYNGEIAFLWHNSTVEKTSDSYHRKLYKDLINYLLEK